MLLLLRGAATHAHLSPTSPPPNKKTHETRPLGEGLADRTVVNGNLYFMDGGDSEDHEEDKNDEEAFHPNYIPQCFFIDGSRSKC